MTRYFMAYATANEGDYFADFLNFRRLARCDPGVPMVEVSIVISEVRPTSEFDRKIVEKLASMLEQNPRIRCRSITFKSNVGRDFSSAATALDEMAMTGQDDDYAFFVNRSASGPLMHGWYEAYVKGLAETKAWLVGTSINGSGHPLGRNPGHAPHVQTYTYLAQLGTLRPLVGNFPAQNIEDRTQLIEEGEIGLSKWIMDAGGAIACLAWPGKRFDKTSLPDGELALGDIKESISGTPFLYRKNKHLPGWVASIFDRRAFRKWKSISGVPLAVVDDIRVK